MIEKIFYFRNGELWFKRLTFKVDIINRNNRLIISYMKNDKVRCYRLVTNKRREGEMLTYYD